MAATLEKLDITNLQDLLFHLPYRYVDRTRAKPIRQLRINDVALVSARVLDSKIAFGRRRSLHVMIEDDSGGELSLRFFHFNAAQKNSFEKGRAIEVFGEVRIGASGAEMYHPEYEFGDDSAEKETRESTLTPYYSLTEGISQQRLRGFAQQAVELIRTHPPRELLPVEVNAQFGTDSLAKALTLIHFPPPELNQQKLLDGTHPFQQRLAFEELLAHFIAKQKIRAQVQAMKAPSIPSSPRTYSSFLEVLPFKPTGAQQRVFAEIQSDLKKSAPMLRMVQGDVGSGKTLVAALAAKACIDAGFQVAIVAPTEILAEQHLQNFKQWLEPFSIRIDWLVGKLSPKQKQGCYQRLRDHEVDLVVGTHALFEEGVLFAKLALTIVDEQHRFGVHQRLSLRSKSLDGQVPHQLVMTATPIPRTLAMASFAEMDFSIIDELPPGRQPITTVVVNQNRKQSVVERVLAACAEGRQVYWVCPLVEQSETLSVANAEDTFEELKSALPGIKLELIHGRLKPAEKEERMSSFKRADTQVLVATTVIEVGVDVPNATIMVIENPERLGLAQLHQLRGRVGRGSQDSHCILLYGEKLSQQGRQRLQILRSTNDGFVIAEEDLKMRGPGEFLGTRQAGDMLYKIADHQRDAALYPKVQDLGLSLLRTDPETSERIVERWFGNRRKFALA